MHDVVIYEESLFSKEVMEIKTDEYTIFVIDISKQKNLANGLLKSILLFNEKDGVIYTIQLPKQFKCRGFYCCYYCSRSRRRLK